MIVMVTQDDINIGKPAKCGDCPIAIAAKRAAGPDHTVMVSSKHLYVYDALGNPEAYYLPLIARNFIRAFDGDAPVVPFSFSAVRLAV